MLGPAILIGVGLGGLFDGIVLHQILQWHHLLSAPTPPVTVEALELNTLADGLFHAMAWLVTAIGLAWLVTSSHRERPPDARPFLGGILLGWGAFNLVEGVVDHHVLTLHHVRQGPDALAYDLAFLAWGAAMMVAGFALRSRGTSVERASSARRPTPSRSSR